jgi:hypothetical protein
MRCRLSISGRGSVPLVPSSSNVPAAVMAKIAPRTLQGTGVPAGL